MSIKVLTQVMEHSAARLADRLVLFVLAEHADTETRECFPSVPLIARLARLSERQVHRSLAALETAPLNEIVRVGTRPRGVTVWQVTDCQGGDKSGSRPLTNRVSAPLIEPSRNRQQELPSLVAKQEPKTNQGQGSKTPYPAAEVFTYWIERMRPTRRPKFTDDRRSKIEARLREGYGVDMLKLAIDGCAASDWHMGRDPKNDRTNGGRLYNSIDLIFRNGEHVERFADLAPATHRYEPERVRQARSVMTDDEIDDARAAGEYPFDRASIDAIGAGE